MSSWNSAGGAASTLATCALTSWPSLQPVSGVAGWAPELSVPPPPVPGRLAPGAIVESSDCAAACDPAAGCHGIGYCAQLDVAALASRHAASTTTTDHAQRIAVRDATTVRRSHRTVSSLQGPETPTGEIMLG